MNSFRNFLSFGLNVCPGCGSFQPGESLLCLPCEKKVLSKAQAFSETVSGFPVRFLFRWNPGESDVLSRLILSLKGPHQQTAWRWWAQVFFDIHASRINQENYCLVSGPLRPSQSRADHSGLWANGLADCFGLENEGALFRKEREESARKLDLFERQRRRRLVKITETSLGQDRFWVMTDDILTTGSTARAIYEGLASPLKYEVWCLAYRTRSSCDGSAPVLRR